MPCCWRKRLRRGSAALVAALMAPVLAGAPPLSAQQGPAADMIAQCAACHGDDGIARDIEVPHLAGQNERYLYNQMVAFRAGKRPHREMRHMAREMTLEDIAAIAAHYAALPPR